MAKVLCFGKNQISKIVEEATKESPITTCVVSHPSFDLKAMLELKPEIIVIGETEIDLFNSAPLLEEASYAHRFIVLGFLQDANLQNRLTAYNVGAQDCLSSEMPPEEIRVKMQTFLRQAHLMQVVPPSIHSANMLLFPMSKRVLIDDQEIKLSNKEYEILYFLSIRQNQVVPTEELIAAVWKGTAVSSGNVYTQFYKLKKKLKEFKGEIITIYGVGFKLEA